VGSEDLFKKRKAALASQLRRREANKTGKETVLIVCEGQKTEPVYLNALLRQLNLQQRVRLGEILVDDRKNGLDPSKLVERAIQLFFDKRAEGMTYDRVYCVFDKDCHTEYGSACNKINEQPLRETRNGETRQLAEMIAITSVPCFEVWLLLHFTDSSAPFYGSGNKTPCDHVIAKLKTYKGFENYQKRAPDAFEKTKDKLETALTHAKRIWKQIPHNGDNPSTRIFELVTYLKEQASN